MRNRIEQFLKSTAFTLLCSAIWVAMCLPRFRLLATKPSIMEAIWVAYNTLIAVLFLIRTRPSHVSTNPVHWLVALTASFSGLFFRFTPSAAPTLDRIGDALVLAGIFGDSMSGLALRRSYDFLPALRGVSTGTVYRIVRHPMYFCALLLRFGYVLKHPSAYNAAIYFALVALYVLRAGYEEQIMLHDPRYQTYAARVRWRFFPGIY